MRRRAIEAVVRDHNVAAAAQHEERFAVLIKLFDRRYTLGLAIYRPELFRCAANPQGRQRRKRRVFDDRVHGDQVSRAAA